MLKVSNLFVLSTVLGAVLILPVSAQPNLEKLLDNVDNSSSWGNTPMSGSAATQPMLTNPSGINTNNQGSSSAYSDWQTAENQASRAYNAEEKARYDKDKWRRGEDANDAYYAAKAARNASDRVYQASVKGDPSAQQYADKARDAAERAKGDAERARYYADSGD